MRTAVPFRQGAVQRPPVLTNRRGPGDEGADMRACAGRHAGMPRTRCVRQRVLRQEAWRTLEGRGVAQPWVALVPWEVICEDSWKERNSGVFWVASGIYLVVVKQRRLNLPDKPRHLFSDTSRISDSIFRLGPGMPDLAASLPEEGIGQQGPEVATCQVRPACGRRPWVVSADRGRGRRTSSTSHLRMSYRIHRPDLVDTGAPGTRDQADKPETGLEGRSGRLSRRRRPEECGSAYERRTASPRDAPPRSCKSPREARLCSSAEPMGFGSRARRAPF